MQKSLPLQRSAGFDGVQPLVIDHHHLSWLHIPDKISVDQVQRACLLERTYESSFFPIREGDPKDHGAPDSCGSPHQHDGISPDDTGKRIGEAASPVRRGCAIRWRMISLSDVV